MTSTNESDTTAHALRSNRSRTVRRVLALVTTFGLFAAVASTASAQLAGATAADPASATTTTPPLTLTPPAHAPKASKTAVRARASSLAASPGIASASTLSAPLVIAQAPSAPTPQSSVTAAPSTTNVSVIASTNAAPPSNTCIPDCRGGFVCREGECVSACNPTCGEGETCNSKRECVPQTAETETRAYDKVRFGVGGHIGVGDSSDGAGTAFGGHIMVAVPLGSHLYTREDIMASYFHTNAVDTTAFGGVVGPYGTGAPEVDQEYLLIALRATIGYQIGNYVNARAGVLVGSHTLSVDHGFCGIGPQSQSFTSLAAGGTAALGFALKHFDLSVVGDVYDADTQAVCGVLAGPYAATQPAVLVPRRDVAAQFLAQATILF